MFRTQFIFKTTTGGHITNDLVFNQSKPIQEWTAAEKLDCGCILETEEPLMVQDCISLMNEMWSECFSVNPAYAMFELKDVATELISTGHEGEYHTQFQYETRAGEVITNMTIFNQDKPMGEWSDDELVACGCVVVSKLPLMLQECNVIVNTMWINGLQFSATTESDCRLKKITTKLIKVV